MTLSYKEVADILKIIDSSQCEEVVLELEGARLVVRRGGTGAASAPAAAAPAAAAAPVASATQAPRRAAPATEPADGLVVRAPMVGTFYRRPSPDDPPFVEEGATVKAGDPLCLIEVMKLYTTIEAPADGTVTAIAAEDGALVEFDQPLVVLGPA